MRRSRDRDNLVLKDEAGRPYGFYLASDFTSHHEFGIAMLEHSFGIDRSLPGIPGRSITRPHPQTWTIGTRIRVETKDSRKGRRRYRNHDIAMLIVGTYNFSGNTLTSREFAADGIEILGSFSEEAFAIAAYSDTAKAALEEVKYGIENNDLAILMGGKSRNPFDRGGLVIARASMIPAEQAQVTMDADLEERRLQEAVTATGIVEKIDAKPINYGRLTMKRYHALAPAWIIPSILKDRTTAHPVMFYLNPAQQDRNNYGWFTVEELEQWLDGYGPIPKSPIYAESDT
jgi:hypothetical protein